MITIDGSQGEGGGQILRTALALYMVTGRPFRIERIRAKRDKPGLMRQHLTAVRAAMTVSAAQVVGAEIGSQNLLFEPGTVVGGDYHFSVGTAGSATLVLQTVLPALMLADTPSHLTLEGGTHNPHAPPFDFLDQAFLPLLRRMGVGVEAKLYRPGFYPAGGGRFVVDIAPAVRLEPIELMTRGALQRHWARATVANLPLTIAERELAVVRRRLDWTEADCEAREETRAAGPGNILLVGLEFADVTELFTGFGQPRVSAETVAERTVMNVGGYLASKAAVGPHLADQLLVPMALARGGRFTTLRPSSHARTNADVIRQFLDVDIRFREQEPKLWQVDIASEQR